MIRHISIYRNFYRVADIVLTVENRFPIGYFGCVWIFVGGGDELLGVLGHVDVVPAGTGWYTDPFGPVIKDGKLYARGASDDKGPTVAAYYALKMIRDLELPVSKRIRVIIGTDEESGWGCMDHYLNVAETPDFGFSPDAYFPIINGEKGNVSVNLNFKG